jgi:hypothetical protein
MKEMHKTRAMVKLQVESRAPLQPVEVAKSGGYSGNDKTTRREHYKNTDLPELFTRLIAPVCKGAKRRKLNIDGEYYEVDAGVKLADIVGREVKQVVSQDGNVIPRSEFSKVQAPAVMTTNLAEIEKG